MARYKLHPAAKELLNGKMEVACRIGHFNFITDIFKGMYLQPHYTETDENLILAFMQTHPFAVLTGTDGKQCVATQVPLLIKGAIDNLKLYGHMMCGTDHHIAFQRNPATLALFTGPHCYVSAGLYSQQHTAGTWNYMTVHVRGNIRFTDATETLDILKEQTRHFEQGRENPVLVEDMPEAYIQANIRMITGFVMEVSALYPIFKLSQPQDDVSYNRIIDALSQSADAGAYQIAGEMRKRRPGQS